MKTKAINIIAILVLTMALMASCGGKKDGNKLELDVTNAKVEGDSANVISIADGKYTIVGTEKGQMGQELYIKVKLRLERPVKAAYNQVFFSGIPGIMILDKNDVPMLANQLVAQDRNALERFITEGKAGDEKEIGFAFTMMNEEQFKKVLEEAATIKFVNMSYSINNAISPAEDSQLAVSEDVAEMNEDEPAESVDEGDSESSEDIDELLAEYEQYYDSYIKMIRKANKGDMTALADYADMLQKAQEIGNKLENVKGDLSAKQLAAFNRINNKLMKAAQEMR